MPKFTTTNHRTGEVHVEREAPDRESPRAPRIAGSKLEADLRRRAEEKREREAARAKRKTPAQILAALKALTAAEKAKR